MQPIYTYIFSRLIITYKGFITTVSSSKLTKTSYIYIYIYYVSTSVYSPSAFLSLCVCSFLFFFLLFLYSYSSLRNALMTAGRLIICLVHLYTSGNSTLILIPILSTTLFHGTNDKSAIVIRSHTNHTG